MDADVAPRGREVVWRDCFQPAASSRGRFAIS